ncbi:MAG: hypothetical protein PVI97_12930 [Candidatus Thiodiazotropha sp.]|jgi:hypothetical protein
MKTGYLGLVLGMLLSANLLAHTPSVEELNQELVVSKITEV